MNQDLSRKLFDRFPFYAPTKLTEGLMAFGFECGDGWFQILWDLSLDIESLLQQHHRPGFRVVQVKEKYGTLRFYTTETTPDIEVCVDRAEGQSAATCETCGRPGTARGQSWIRTQCDECYFQMLEFLGIIKLEPLDDDKNTTAGGS